MIRQLFLFFQQFHIADNGRQRRLDVMGNIGNQLHLHTLAADLFINRFLHSLPYFVYAGYRIMKIGICR